MTPYEMIIERYKLPFCLYEYQILTVNALAPLRKTGHYLSVGVGKTATSTACALYKFLIGDAQKAIVLMPPILLTSWYRWLSSISGTSAMIYRGSPKARLKLSFDTDFVLMSYQVFKLDQARILAEFDNRSTVLICDEATAVKNSSSATHKVVRDFSLDGFLMLLTGTPLAKIDDAFAYIKLLAPSIYRDMAHFQNIHHETCDWYGNPTRYGNLDMLNRNMSVNAVRLLKEDVLDDLPPVTYSPLFYELEPRHLKLYKQLEQENLLRFNDGSVISALETTALWHALQQIVMAYDFYSGMQEARSAGYDLIDEILAELDGAKLIIFTNYRRTSIGVTQYLKDRGAVSVFGDVTPDKQQQNIDRFLNDPQCRVLVAQVQSAGYGLNLQSACSDVLFIESPLSPIHFEQAVGRVYRNGQANRVHVRIAIAEKTIQIHLHRLLLHKDALVNKVVRNYQDIVDALYGTTSYPADMTVN